MPDQAFRSLFTETERIRWDSMNQVRTRARRRTIGRTAAVAGLVAVALVSGGVAVAQIRQGPATPPVATQSPSPSPSVSSAPAPPPSTPSSPPPSASPGTSTETSSPPVTAITPAMMLRPQDVGSGYRVVANTDGDWTFEFSAAALGCPRGVTPEPVAERERTLRKGQPQDDTFVIQHTGRYAAGAAARYLDEIRERVSSCSPAGERSVRVAAEGFAGDEAVLVVFDLEGGYVSKTLLVREGDVLTEIFTKPTRSDSATRELGRRAADRF